MAMRLVCRPSELVCSTDADDLLSGSKMTKSSCKATETSGLLFMNPILDPVLLSGVHWFLSDSNWIFLN